MVNKEICCNILQRFMAPQQHMRKRFHTSSLSIAIDTTLVFPFYFRSLKENHQLFQQHFSNHQNDSFLQIGTFWECHRRQRGRTEHWIFIFEEIPAYSIDASPEAEDAQVKAATKLETEDESTPPLQRLPVLRLCFNSTTAVTLPRMTLT